MSIKIKIKSMLADREGYVDFDAFIQRQINQLKALHGTNSQNFIRRELDYVGNNLINAMKGIDKHGIKEV